MDHLSLDTKYLKEMRAFYRYGEPRDLKGSLYPVYGTHMVAAAMHGNVLTLQYFIEKYGLEGVNMSSRVGGWVYQNSFEAAARYKHEECARMIADSTLRLSPPAEARLALSEMLLDAVRYGLEPLARYILITCLNNAPDDSILPSLFADCIRADMIGLAEYLVEHHLHISCTENHDCHDESSIFYDLVCNAIEAKNLPFVQLYQRIYMETTGEGWPAEHIRWLIVRAVWADSIDIIEHVESVCPKISVEDYEDVMFNYARTCETVRYLLLKGCNPTKGDVGKLFHIAGKPEHRDMADMLIAAGVPEEHIYTFRVLQTSVRSGNAKTSWLHEVYEKMAHKDAEDKQKLQGLLVDAMYAGSLEFFMYLAEKIDMRRDFVHDLMRRTIASLKRHAFLDYMLERRLVSIEDVLENGIPSQAHDEDYFAVFFKHGMDVQNDVIMSALIASHSDDSLRPMKMMLERGYKLDPRAPYIQLLTRAPSRIYGKKLGILLDYGADLGNEDNQMAIACYVMNNGRTGYHLRALLKRPLSNAIKDAMMEIAVEKEDIQSFHRLALAGARVTRFNHSNHSPMFMRMLMQHGARTTCLSLLFLREYRAEHGARCILRWGLGRMVKEYLYHPCGRHTTEDLELWHEHGDITYPEGAIERLREARNKMVEELRKATDMPELPCEVPLPDGSGSRSLIPHPGAKLTRLQHLYRLPTPILRSLCSPEPKEKG